MAERILEMPPLGDRRPSKLLAAMLKYCPEGVADGAFFHTSYFRRLMADEVNGNMQDMAIRGGELFQHQWSTMVTAMAEDGCLQQEEDLSEAMAALNMRGGGGFSGSKKK